jgi:hypothetical protein
MVINHETAMKLWKEKYGKADRAYDRKKWLMLKGAYGDENSEYGWNIHHRMAVSKGGTNVKENLEIVHVLTHKEINWTTV